MKPSMKILMFAIVCIALAACKSNQFVGTWKPDTDRSLAIQTLEIKKDATWVMTGRNDRLTGTYTISGNTLQLTGTALKRKTELTLESNGRLKMVEEGRDSLMFKKSS